jgi:hypothetical protein
VEVGEVDGSVEGIALGREVGPITTMDGICEGVDEV